MSHPRSRRVFLQASAIAPLVLPGVRAAEDPPVPAAILGHTGGGDYGHGLDLIFRNRPGIACVAVADPDPAGRAAAQHRTGALRAYADHRELLEREKPRLVSIAMRHSSRHHALVLDCLRAGAHCYVEKPFTDSAIQAADLCREAERRGLTIAVAHTMRMGPATRRLQRVIQEGGLGEIAEVRAHGKQDARAGGEDMVVLGTHLFDLFRLFCGDPISVSAQVTQQGRPITREDRRRVKDNIGWIAGDRVTATFAFNRGVTATFISDARLRAVAGPWGLEIRGSKATARLLADLVPRVLLRTASAAWDAAAWTPLPGVEALDPTAAQTAPVSDWLACVSPRGDRQPQCSGWNGAWAVRMAAACWESSLQERTIRFEGPPGPHPLGD